MLVVVSICALARIYKKGFFPLLCISLRYVPKLVSSQTVVLCKGFITRPYVEYRQVLYSWAMLQTVAEAYSGQNMTDKGQIARATVFKEDCRWKTLTLERNWHKYKGENVAQNKYDHCILPFF